MLREAQYQGRVGGLPRESVLHLAGYVGTSDVPVLLWYHESSYGKSNEAQEDVGRPDRSYRGTVKLCRPFDAHAPR